MLEKMAFGSDGSLGGFGEGASGEMGGLGELLPAMQGMLQSLLSKGNSIFNCLTVFSMIIIFIFSKRTFVSLH